MGGKMQRKKRISVVIMALMTIGGWSGEPDIDMKEGKWEITVQMEMPGMPMSMPAMTSVQCLTGENKTPKVSAASGNCRVVRTEMKGKTYMWDVECDTGEGKNISHGEITYMGDTFSGFFKVQQGGITVTNRMKGRRIGPCD